MLIGRQAELDRIATLLDAARDGHADALVLRGEPGIGKTALLDWAAAHADGFRVLRAVGVESEAELPCAGLHQLLRPLLGRLDELPAPQAAALRAALAIDAAASTERFAVYVGTLGLLAAAAEHEPLLCLIEDAHWLDTASAEALVFAARRLQAEPVAMLFAARVDEGTFDASAVPELALKRLDEAASAELLAAAGRAVGADARRALLQLADGNPLALLELPAGLTAEQRAGAEPIDEPLLLSASLRKAFLGRVRNLSDDGRLALLAAAASARDTVDGDLAARLAEAESAGLVRLDHGVLRFRHPLVRAAAYQAAEPAERRAAHAAHAGRTDDPDERAWHLASAAAAPDEEVAGLLDDVGRRAGQRGSMGGRARALMRAAELSIVDAERARRLIEAARAAFMAGQAPLARAAVDQAEALPLDGLLQADATMLRWDLDASDWHRQFPRMIRDAEAIAERDPRRAANMLSTATDYLADAGRGGEGLALHQRAWALAGRRAAPGFVGVAVDEAWIRLMGMRCKEGLEMALEALDAGSRSDDPADVDDLAYGAQVLVYSEHPAASDVLYGLVARARELGSAPLLCAALTERSGIDLQEGRLPAAYGAAMEAFSIGEVLRGWRGLWTSLALARVEAHLGRAADVQAHVAYAQELASPDSKWWEAFAHRAVGMLALGLGDVDAAARDLELAATLIPSEHPGFFACHTDRAEALLRAGRQPEGISVLADLEDRATRAKLPWTLAAARRCRLLVAREDALDDAGTAALAAFAAGSPFELARTRLVLGERLRRAGRRVDAREQLNAALVSFDQLGAEPWAAQARRELQASGATLRRRDPSAADVLTPQELQVALAVAEGRTNREVAASLFISPKTVELHLSRVYRKLGLRSRTELARLNAAEPERLSAPP